MRLHSSGGRRLFWGQPAHLDSLMLPVCTCEHREQPPDTSLLSDLPHLLILIPAMAGVEYTGNKTLQSRFFVFFLNCSFGLGLNKYSQRDIMETQLMILAVFSLCGHWHGTKI